MVSSNMKVFKRGQAEWALWHTLTLRFGRPEKIPQAFRTRIKRLLEIDRETDGFKVDILPSSQFAFLDTRGSGTGNATQFSAFDVFCLGIALHLLDAGFKQKEIVFLMRYLRRGLDQRFRKILKRLPHGREEIPARDHPDWPAYTYNGTKYADPYVFVVLERVEIPGMVPGAKRDRPRDQGPIIPHPIFCEGYDELNRCFRRMPLGFNRAVVMELAQLAATLQDFLNKSPDFRRGRR